MSDPVLLVIAGCNGSGKSSFSKSLVPDNFIPFDYDRCFIEIYQTLFDSDIREVMAHNMAFDELERQIQIALTQRTNFCYETNFNSTPLHWPQYFKQNGYKVHLIYLCLNSIDEAKRRVAIRVQNGGHFVPNDEIKKRYFDGFENFNMHFQFFDLIDVFDTSGYLEVPKHLFSIEDGIITANKGFPDYLVKLIPGVVKII